MLSNQLIVSVTFFTRTTDWEPHVLGGPLPSAVSSLACSRWNALYMSPCNLPLLVANLKLATTWQLVHSELHGRHTQLCECWIFQAKVLSKPPAMMPAVQCSHQHDLANPRMLRNKRYRTSGAARPSLREGHCSNFYSFVAKQSWNHGIVGLIVCCMSRR